VRQLASPKNVKTNAESNNVSVRGGEDLSQGEAEEGFDKLDEFGVIREIEKTDERIKSDVEPETGAICDRSAVAGSACGRNVCGQLYVSSRPEGGLFGAVSEYNATTGEVIKTNCGIFSG
jgi:hypothetical protein